MERVANCGGVVGARQSMDVPVEDQHDRRAPMVGEPPGASIGVDALEVWSRLTQRGSDLTHVGRSTPCGRAM